MRRHAILVGLILLAVSLVTAASLHRLLRPHRPELERKAAELDRGRGIVPVQYPPQYYPYRQAPYPYAAAPYGYAPPAAPPPPPKASLCVTSAGQCALPPNATLAVGSPCTCYSPYGTYFGVAR
jgi:hypothetical protein